MQTFETAAVVSLIDHLSGPLGKLGSHVGSAATRFDKHAAAMEAAGKKMTYAYTLPAIAIGKHMMDKALEFDKVENTLQGVLMTRHKTMKDLTQTHEQYAKAQRVIIDQASEMAYKNSGGMVNPLEFRKSVMGGIKAGFDTESSAAAARQAFDLSLAGRIDQHEAMDQLITLANSFHLKLKDEHGKALPTEKLNKAFASMADLLTTMSTNANMTEQQAFESLKLAAPLAHYTRLHPVQLGVLSETMAESGFKGSEAGVALRSIMQAFTAPKSTAIPMLRQAGIDINKFRTFKPDYDMGPEAFEKYIKGLNYGVNHQQVVRAYQQAHKLADASGGALTFQGALTDTLAPLIHSKGKKQLPIGPDLARKRIMDFVSAGSDTVDMFGAILEMRDKHLTGAQLKKFMEGRQIPRALSFLAGPQKGDNDVFGNAMKRAYGDDWEAQIKKFHAAGESYGDALEHLIKVQGAARQQALEHANNIEGGYLRIGAAFSHLTERLYKAGAFDAFARGMGHLADLVDKFAGQSAGMQKFEVGAVAFLAGIGPILALAGRLAMAGKALTTFAGGLAAITGLKGLAGAGARAAAGAGGAVVAGEAAGGAGAVAGGAGILAPLGWAGGLAAFDAGMYYILEKYKQAHPEQHWSPTVGGPGAYDKYHGDPTDKGGVYHNGDKYGPNRRWVSNGRGAGGHWENEDPYVVPGYKPEEYHGRGANRSYNNDQGTNSRYHPDTKSRNLIGPEGSNAYIIIPDTRGKKIETNHWMLPNFAPRSEKHPLHPHADKGEHTPSQIKVTGDVRGTVTGEASIKQTVSVTVSPELKATIASAQNIVKMGLQGKLGGTMGGSNGAKPSAPTPT